MSAKIAVLTAIIVVLIWLSGSGMLIFGQETGLQAVDVKPRAFLRSWYVLGPIIYHEGDEDVKSDSHAKEALIKGYIKEDSNSIISAIRKGTEIKIADKGYMWKKYESSTDFVDLNEALGESSYAVAYAYVMVYSSEDADVIMGIGTDDGAEVYINQEPVFESFTEQKAQRDNDLIPVKLNEGENHILIKIQNSREDWGFYARILDDQSINERFVRAAYQGNLDDIDLLLSAGADINSTDALGLTALHRAKIGGRTETCDYLIEKGADESLPMPEAEEVLDTCYNLIFNEDTPGASILFSRDGKIIYHKSYGNADIGNNVPFTNNTKSRIGSVTKQFVSSAILRMIEEGKISLDDKLADFIPGFPRGDEVTIHHLLTHTSGIQSYTNKQEFMEKLTSEVDTIDIINFIWDDEYNFDPGDGWLYNNSGYVILGYILEQVTEKPLGEYLKEIFFIPLGMNDTGIHNSRDIIKNEAYGFSYENGIFRKAVNWDMSWAGGAGALYSTAYDLYLWNEAVFNKKLLSGQSLDMAFTPVTLNDGSMVENPFKYGYGWIISEKRGLKEISHGGGLHGFNTDLRRYTDLNATVAVLQNCIPSGEGMSAGELAETAVEMYLWEDMSEQESYRTAQNISTENWDIYTGSYNYSGIVMKVRREGDQMFAKLAFQNEFEIFPKADNEFFWKVVDAQIRFICDEEGNVTHAVHKQGGREIKAVKITDNIIADIDKSVYKDYIGEYDFSVFTITVFEEDQSLFIQISGQPRLEIFPRSDTEFFSDAVVIKVVFTKDQEKNSMKMTLHQMGMVFEGYRAEGEKEPLSD